MKALVVGFTVIMGSIAIFITCAWLAQSGCHTSGHDGLDIKDPLWCK